MLKDVIHIMPKGEALTNTNMLFENAMSHAIAYRQDVATSKPRPVVQAEVLDQKLCSATPERGEDASKVIDELVQAATPGLMGVTGGRFFGWVIGGSHPAGVAADWLASAWGQNAGNFHCSPSAAMSEKAVSGWLLDILNLDRGCSVGFVTGATMANFTCLAAARSEVLSRVGWNVEEDGLNGAPPITVYIGADAHTTVLNGLQYLGLGRKRVTTIPTNDQGQMCAASLAEHLQVTAGPKIVIAQAGQINTGAIDPFTEIVAACHSTGAWLHVDGAFGLWANACPSTRAMCENIEKADSWSVDGHKWLQLPYDSGFAIVRHPAAHRRAMNITASYLPETKGSEYQASQYVPELSRRARGFAAWALIKTIGREGIINMIERHCSFAKSVDQALNTVSGIRVINKVVLNQLIIRFGDSDLATQTVIKTIQERNNVFVEGGMWREEKVMRISIISGETKDSDIDLLINEIKDCWKQTNLKQTNSRKGN